MQSVLTWSGRLALLAVLVVAGIGAVDPNHNAAAMAPPPDVAEHVVYGYLLTVLTILAAPRVNPWLIGAAYLALATGFEVAQTLGLVSGTFQVKDLAANLGGILAALAPFALARRAVAAAEALRDDARR